MRVPLDWLAEFVDAAGAAERSPSGAHARRASRSRRVERIGPDLSGVRVGHVLERAPHPNADRLSRLPRRRRRRASRVEVVCGAPNVAAGQKVAVALAGRDAARRHASSRRAKIRGVVSTA